MVYSPFIPWHSFWPEKVSLSYTCFLPMHLNMPFIWRKICQNGRRRDNYREMPSLTPLHSAYLHTLQCCAVGFFLPISILCYSNLWCFWLKMLLLFFNFIFVSNFHNSHVYLTVMCVNNLVCWCLYNAEARHVILITIQMHACVYEGP